MKKALTKVTACSLAVAMTLTFAPISAQASSVLPAAGCALATGVGSSIKDIKAEKARTAAKEAEIKARTGESEKKEDKDVKGKKNSMKPKASQKNENVKKIDTPASLALKESNTNDADSEIKTSAIIKVSNSSENEDGVARVSTNSSVAIDAAISSVVKNEIGNVPIGSGAKQASVNTVENGAETNNSSKGGSAEGVPDINIKPEAAEVAEGEENLIDTIIAKCDGYVNVRDKASEEGEVVGKLYNKSAGKWLGKEGDWYKISSGNVVGYVKGEYVVTGQAAVELAAEVGERIATVTTTTLKVRDEANADATVLGLVPMQDRLTVLEETAEWIKVSIEEGDGWVSKEFVDVATEFVKAESKAEEEARLKKEEEARRAANAAAAKAAKKNKKGGKSSGGGGSYYVSGGSGSGSSVANYALQFVGNPYVYGGTSLTSGTDCSGFTMGVYRNFGVSLPHSSGAQRSCGYGVASLSQAQPGDLICYSGHVALYIGGGQIVHASTAKTGIKVSNAGYRQILAIRRIF